MAEGNEGLEASIAIVVDKGRSAQEASAGYCFIVCVDKALERMMS